MKEKQRGRKEKEGEKKQISDKGIYEINDKPFQKAKNLELNLKNVYFLLLIFGTNLTL